MNFTSSGTGLQNFDKFLDTPPTYQYHTDDIGDIRKKNYNLKKNQTNISFHIQKNNYTRNIIHRFIIFFPPF